MVVLHVLGQAIIRTAVGTITPRADTGFALAVYLIAQRGRRVPRDLLLSLLWPHDRGRKSAHALTEALHKLRRRGFPVATDHARYVWLPRDAAAIDLDLLAGEPPERMRERDLSILPGYAPPGSPAFRDWVDEWRRSMETRVVEQLLDAMARAELAEEWRVVLGVADCILRADADNSDALRATAHAAAALRDERMSPRRKPRRDLPAPGSGRRSAVGEPGASDAWALPAAGFAPARDTMLVGRGDELDVLRSALDNASRGQGSCVLVSGAAGMGKSRLMREVMAESHARAISVAFTSCQQYDGHRPLSAFVDAVPYLRQLPGAAGADPTMVPDLDRLTGYEAAQVKARPDAADADYVFSRLRHALFDLVEAVCEERPLLLVVENVQWLDTASWALLREMMTWAASHLLVIALTSREPWDLSMHGLPPASLRLRPLLPLDPRAAAEHARNYADVIGHEPPPAVLEWCTSASEGNPYLLEELLNHWAGTGEQFQTPPSLALLLDTRLTRLAPSALHVLQTCAVLGKNSTLTRIERVLEQSRSTLFSALEELGHAGMLRIGRDEAAGGNSLVLCRHDALAQAAVRRLSVPGRELLHRRSGIALEAELAGPDTASLMWDCAEHWYEAGNSVRAVELGLACVAHLLDIGLARAAADGCEKTLRYCVRTSDREAVLRVYAHALYLDLRWDDVSATVKKIRELDANAPVHVHDDLELLAIDADWHRRSDGESLVAEAVRCAAAENADPTHRVRAGTLALKVATNLGDKTTMDAVFSALGDSLASPLISETDRATAQMIYHAICGDLDVAADCARRLLRDTDAGTTTELQRLTRAINCAATLYRAGSVQEAEAEYMRVFERASELRAFAIAGDACGRLFTTYLDNGDMPLASEWVRKYMRLELPETQMWQQRRLRLALARLELWNESYNATAHLLENDGQPLWEIPFDVFRAAALATKIRLEIARGRDDQVTIFTALLRTTTTELRTMGAQDFEMFSLYLGLRHAGAEDEAIELLSRYLVRERRDRMPVTGEIREECDRLGIRLRD